MTHPYTIKPCPYALHSVFYADCPKDVHGLPGPRCADCSARWTERLLREWHHADRRQRRAVAVEVLWGMAGRPDGFMDGLWRMTRLGICRPESRLRVYGQPIWTHWALLG